MAVSRGALTTLRLQFESTPVCSWFFFCTFLCICTYPLPSQKLLGFFLWTLLTVVFRSMR
jgi:hypothetical protein